MLTHLHGDHFGGLPFLVLDGQFRRRAKDLTVVGSPGTGTRLHAAVLLDAADGVDLTGWEVAHDGMVFDVVSGPVSSG